jgi:hypothetical protein
MLTAETSALSAYLGREGSADSLIAKAVAHIG